MDLGLSIFVIDVSMPVCPSALWDDPNWDEPGFVPQPYGIQEGGNYSVHGLQI